MNERLSRAGLKPIAKIKDLPKDFKIPDAYLDEAVEITLDLAPKYPKIESRVPNAGVIQLDTTIQ